MSSRLVNVRIDEKRLEKARRLRARGIALSQLVRDAIDRQYELLVQSAKARDVEAIMKEVYEQYPDPADMATPTYDVHDRAEARRAILRRLRRHR
jgi:hypothetical protein